MPNYQKGWVSILVLLLLIAGIVAGVISVQQAKIFFSRAQSNRCSGTPAQQIAEDLGPSGKPGYAQNYNIYPNGCREKVGDEYLIGSPMANRAVDLGPQGKPGYAQNYNIYPDGKWEKDGEPYKIGTDPFADKYNPTATHNKTGKYIPKPIQFGEPITPDEDRPPLSVIPEICKSIGKSVITRFARPVANDSGLPDVQTSVSKGQVALNNGKSIIGAMGLYVSNSGLVYLWDEEGTAPLSQGGEDPRYVIRVVRIAAYLGDPNYRRYWWGRKNGGLDLKDGCEYIQRLKEEWKQQGKPLPTDDDIERQAYLWVG